MRIPRSFVRQYKDIRSYNEYPPYFKLLQIVLAVVGVFTLAYLMLKPDTSAEDAAALKQLARVVTPTYADPAAPSAGASGSPSASATPDGSAVVTVKNAAGEDVTVPQSAVSTATAAAKALFTGDFSVVNLAPGVTAPELSGSSWEDPQVAAPVVQSVDSTTAVFQFAIDPDGPNGAEGVRTLSATVTNTNGIWGYAG